MSGFSQSTCKVLKQQNRPPSVRLTLTAVFVSHHTNKKGKRRRRSVVVQIFRFRHNSGVAEFGTTVSVHKQKPVFTDHTRAGSGQKYWEH